MTVATPSVLGGRYRAMVVGGSAGGSKALAEILRQLPASFPLPILAVQHLHPSDDGALARHLARETSLRVIAPCDKEPIVPGCVYVAPANYHMLVERTGTIALSLEDRVNYSRPSIDVTFESAASAWGASVIAVVLSGANSDGAKGARAVKAAGGMVIVQDPGEAEHPVMPRAAIAMTEVDKVLGAAEIGRLLAGLATSGDTPIPTRPLQQLSEQTLQ